MISDPLMMQQWQYMADGLTCFLDKSKWHKTLPRLSLCLWFSPPSPLPASLSVLHSQIDGSICLFMNTEVTCNQAERAQAALCSGTVSAT